MAKLTIFKTLAIFYIYLLFIKNNAFGGQQLPGRMEMGIEISSTVILTLRRHENQLLGLNATLETGFHEVASWIAG